MFSLSCLVRIWKEILGEMPPLLGFLKFGISSAEIVYYVGLVCVLNSLICKSNIIGLLETGQKAVGEDINSHTFLNGHQDLT